MKEKKSILILLHQIQKYRVPVFRILSENFNITLATSEEEKLDSYKNENFNVIFLPLIKLGPFILHKRNLHMIANNYDVVIGLMNLRTMDILSLAFNPFIKSKIIFWGIGVSASKDKRFDEEKKLDMLRNYFYKKADALIFYSDYAKEKYITNGFQKNMLFVANNTVEVLDLVKKNKETKKRILFVGALHPRKGIGELLEAYLLALKKTGNPMFELTIIGEGPEEKRIKQFISKNKLFDKINLTGGIYDQNILRDYFASSILCVSPNQAGLSVLTSMGYSVCFVTHENAITGGEIFNIKNNITGILYSKKEDLIDILIEAFNNKKKYINIGENAKKYYDENRSPYFMAKSIEDSIKYAIR